GEKAYMSPGDFVITANWAPHDHGNASDKPMLWLDVLDFPQVNFFETSFAEQFSTATQPTSRGDGDSLSFYGSGVLPDGAPAGFNHCRRQGAGMGAERRVRGAAVEALLAPGEQGIRPVLDL